MEALTALADPVRRELVALLAHGELAAGELADRFPVSRPAISRHLRVLREAGLVDCERRATWVYYWIRPQVMGELSALLQVADRSAP